jgi:hypothetical protein
MTKFLFLSVLVLLSGLQYITGPWSLLLLLPFIGGLWKANDLWNENKKYEGIVHNIKKGFLYILENGFDDPSILEHSFDDPSILVVI